MNKIIYCLIFSLFVLAACNKKKKEEPAPVIVIPPNPGFDEQNFKNPVKGDVNWTGGLQVKQVGKCTFEESDTLIYLGMTKYATDSVRFEQSMYIKSTSAWYFGKPLVGTLKGNNLSLIQKNKINCFGTDVNNIYSYTGIIENVNSKIRLTITGTETWCKEEECIFDVKYVVYQE